MAIIYSCQSPTFAPYLEKPTTTSTAIDTNIIKSFFPSSTSLEYL